MFSWLPAVTTLPTIGGFDIDSALISGMGQVQTIFSAFWPLQIMFIGFLFIMGYFIIKVGVRIFFGSRTPGN